MVRGTPSLIRWRHRWISPFSDTSPHVLLPLTFKGAREQMCPRPPCASLLPNHIRPVGGRTTAEISRIGFNRASNALTARHGEEKYQIVFYLPVELFSFEISTFFAAPPVFPLSACSEQVLPAQLVASFHPDEDRLFFLLRLSGPNGRFRQGGGGNHRRRREIRKDLILHFCVIARDTLCHWPWEARNKPFLSQFSNSSSP